MIDDGLDIHGKEQPTNTNWDQPLIIAEPEIQVCNTILYHILYHIYTLCDMYIYIYKNMTV